MARKDNQTPPQRTRQFYTATDKAKAKAMYLRGLYLWEISKILDIPQRTIENWQTAEKWTAYRETYECKKRAYELSRTGKSLQVIADLLQVSKATISRWIKAESERRKAKASK